LEPQSPWILLVHCYTAGTGPLQCYIPRQAERSGLFWQCLCPPGSVTESEALRALAAVTAAALLRSLAV
jgi:hypothetical protein